MAVSLVGIYSEGSVWLVREVRRVLRLLGVGSKTKNWVDCNNIFHHCIIEFYHFRALIISDVCSSLRLWQHLSLHVLSL